MVDNIHLSGVLLAYSVIIVGVLSPGPAVLGIIGTALERGRKPAVWFTTGVVCGSAFWGSAAALGMSAILLHYSNALYVIKVLGGMYLLWLAWRSMKSAITSKETSVDLSVFEGNAKQMWLLGLLIHLTNPKAIVAWIATIALGVTSSSPVWVSFAIVVGGVFLSCLGHMSYALLFSTQRAARLYLRAKKPIMLVFSTLFGLAGLKLLTSRV